MENEIRPRLSPGNQWSEVISIVREKGIETILSLLKDEAPIDLLSSLRVNQKVKIQDIAEKLRVSTENVTRRASELRSAGFNVIQSGDFLELSSTIAQRPADTIQISGNKKFKFGLTSDNHLCSKYERNDILHSLYDYFEEEGITTVFNCGNMIDGEARFNTHDLKVHGFDGQVKYFIENFPQHNGIETHFITGDDHEGWYTQKFGIDVGKRIVQDAALLGRNDLKYLGHMEHDVMVETDNGTIKIRLLHPGGGTGYATSYQPQKIVESYNPGEKPHILCIGHYHKANYEFIRGVHTIQAGTTMMQSPFMRKKRLAAHLGGWVFEFSVGDDGFISRFMSEFIPFFNRNGFHKDWNYEW